MAGIENSQALGTVIAEEDLHTLGTEQRAGRLAERQIGRIGQELGDGAVRAGGDRQDAFFATGGEVSAGESLVMNARAGGDFANNRTVFLHRAKTDTCRGGVALNRRSKAVMGAGLFKLLRFDLVMGKFIRLDDFCITALVEVDDDLAVMIDDVEGTRAGQWFVDGRRVFNLDIRMVAMRMRRNAAIDEVNGIIVGFEGNDRSAFIDAVKLALAGCLEVPTVFRIVEVEGRGLGVGMIGDKDEIMRVALIVNDMSEVNIDAALVRDGGANLSRTEEQLVEMANGCIWCTLRDDPLQGVRALAEQGRTTC